MRHFGGIRAVGAGFNRTVGLDSSVLGSGVTPVLRRGERAFVRVPDDVGRRRDQVMMASSAS